MSGDQGFTGIRLIKESRNIFKTKGMKMTRSDHVSNCDTLFGIYTHIGRVTPT